MKLRQLKSGVLSVLIPYLVAAPYAIAQDNVAPNSEDASTIGTGAGTGGDVANPDVPAAAPADPNEGFLGPDPDGHVPSGVTNAPNTSAPGSFGAPAQSGYNGPGGYTGPGGVVQNPNLQSPNLAPNPDYPNLQAPNNGPPTGDPAPHSELSTYGESSNGAGYGGAAVNSNGAGYGGAAVNSTAGNFGSPNTYRSGSGNYGGGSQGSYAPYSGRATYSGQSAYGYYRTGQPYQSNGPTSYSPYIPRQYNYSQQQYFTAPAGLSIPATLTTSISTQAAQSGDFIQAAVSENVHVTGWTYIPAGSTLSGSITEAKEGRMFNRSGSLGVTFNRLTLPNGQALNIEAHVVGSIGRYSDNDGTYHGEGWGSKIGGFVERAGIGAGGGALFGTAIGAISGGGIGTGAWSGAAIGGGIGVLDDLMFRKGKNVIIHSGTPLQVQLDQPVQIPSSPATGTQ